jgi:ferredoxin
MADWDIIVDREICMGSGMCYMYASETFDIDESAKAVVKNVDGDSIENIRTAIEACPTGALRLIERSAQTGGQGG